MARTKKTTRPAKRVPLWTECDNLTNALLNNHELSEAEEYTLERVTEVWAILKENPKPVAVKKVMLVLDISRPSAMAWINKSEEFYGDFYKTNVEAERIRQQMRLEAIINNPDTPVKEIIAAEKLLASILGTDKSTETKKKPQAPALIIYTTNASALKEPTEDKEYEAIE